MTQRGERARSLVAALTAVLLAGCGAGGGTGGGAGGELDRPGAPRGASGEGDASPEAGADAAQAVPEGAQSPEQIASQMERDLADFQRLMASRQSGGTRSTSGADGAAGGAGTGADPGGDRPAASPNGTRAGPEGSATAAANAPTRMPEDAGSATTTRPPIDGAADDTQASGTPPRRVAETPEALAAAAAALYRDASRADTPMRSLMALAALSIADPDRPFNPDALSDITEEERRTLSSFHAFCRELGRRLASSDESDEVVRAVEQLAKEMRGERRLHIPRGEFCSAVEGFGHFASIEPREFVAHAAARFVLYFEVDGYRSAELTGEGWKTELSIELSILSERDGVPVWRRDWQTITDLAASQRKDFFVTHIVAIPDALSVGAYVLKVRVRDEQAGSLAERSIPFRMVASPVSSTPTATPRP